MKDSELASLGDPFFALVLGRGRFPRTAAELFAVLNESNDAPYFGSLDTQEWETPDGSDPAEFWKYTRGTPDRPVRAVIEVPSGRGYVLGVVLIDGRPIQFGGQIADRIQMTIRALATRIGQSTANPVRGCVGDAAGQAAGMASAAPPTVEAVLSAAGARGRI